MIGEHQLNRESSRSHSIFTISLEMKMPGEAGDVVVSAVHRGALASAACGSRVSSSIVAAHRYHSCTSHSSGTLTRPIKHLSIVRARPTGPCHLAMISPSRHLSDTACRPARSTWWTWQAVSACQRPRARALCCGRRATSTSPSASWSRHEGAVGAADGQVWSLSGVRCDTDSVLCLPARLRQQQQACYTKHSIQTQGHELQSMSSTAACG